MSNLLNPGGSVLWNSDERIDSAKLNDIGKIAEQSLWDGFVNLLFDDKPGFIGKGCAPSKGAGDLDWVVQAGMGIAGNSGDADTFSADFLPFYVPTIQSGTLAAHDATFARLDVITIKALDVDDEQSTLKILVGGVLTPTLKDTRRKRFFALTVYTGVPSGSPAQPVTPINEEICAVISVPAISGPITVLDARPLTGVSSAAQSYRPWRFVPNSISPKSANKRIVAMVPRDLEGNQLFRPEGHLADANQRHHFIAELYNADMILNGANFQIVTLTVGANISTVNKARMLGRTDSTGGAISVQVEDLTTVYTGKLYLKMTPIKYFDDATLTEVSDVGYPTVIEIDFA